MPIVLLLVVDDDDLRLFISLLLRQDRRLEVHGLTNAPLQALELVETLDPDLIILDDGVDPNVRATRFDTSVLLFTSLDPLPAEQQRADRVLRKDNIVQLLGIVQEMLGLQTRREVG